MEDELFARPKSDVYQYGVFSPVQILLGYVHIWDTKARKDIWVSISLHKRLLPAMELGQPNIQ